MESNKTTSKIIPAKKVVIIELEKVESKSKIQYQSEKKQETGRVVAVGEGKLPVDMKKGDMIVFRRYGEDKLFLDKKEYLFVTFPDVLGVIK